MPVRHVKHAEEAAVEYFPIAHTPVTALRPADAHILPAGHAVHAVPDVDVCNEPIPHAVQAAAASAEYIPAAHTAHVDNPAVAATVPAAQAEQAEAEEAEY